MKAYWNDIASVLNYFGYVGATTPLPVHIKAINYDSASGHYVITYVNAGTSYPSTPTRTKSGTGNDSDPVDATNGLVLTEFSQARLYIIGKDAGGSVVSDTSADVTIWHRTVPNAKEGETKKGEWLKAATFKAVGNYRELIDTTLYHREIYVQLTNISGTNLNSIEIFIAGIEGTEFQQPFSVNPDGTLNVKLEGVNIENANLEVQLEAAPEAGEEADSVILASTLDKTLPSQSNLAPPVRPLKIDEAGRLMMAGAVASEDLNRPAFPIEVAGRWDGEVVYAYLQTAFTNANSNLLFTAVQPGTEGNEISITISDGGAGSSLSVSVSGKDITITGDLTAGVTARQVRDIIYSDARAYSLVRCEFAPGNDGTGNVEALTKTNLANGAGESRTIALACNSLGYLMVYLASTLNEINDSVSTRDIPPPEIVCGGRQQTGTPGTPVQLTSTSYVLKRGVYIRVDPQSAADDWVGVYYSSSSNSIWDSSNNRWAAGILIHRDGDEQFIPIDDPSKIYIDSNVTDAVVVWAGV